MGGDVVVCEEAAFMDLRVFYEVVVPLLEVKDTAMIMISTPVDKYNFYMVMLRMKDKNGESPFYLHICAMQCAACEKEKRLGCTHMEHLRPTWKTTRGNRIASLLYADKRLMAQELLGIASDDKRRAFPSEWIDRLDKAPPFDLDELDGTLPPYIVTACDPNGGGSSQTALISMFVHNNIFVVSLLFYSAPHSVSEALQKLLKSYASLHKCTNVLKTLLCGGHVGKCPAIMASAYCWIMFIVCSCLYLCSWSTSPAGSTPAGSTGASIASRNFSMVTSPINRNEITTSMSASVGGISFPYIGSVIGYTCSTPLYARFPAIFAANLHTWLIWFASSGDNTSASLCWYSSGFSLPSAYALSTSWANTSRINLHRPPTIFRKSSTKKHVSLTNSGLAVWHSTGWRIRYNPYLRAK